MITGSLKNKINSIWQDFYNENMAQTSEIVNQLTTLMFIKMLDDKQNAVEAQASIIGIEAPQSELTFKKGNYKNIEVINGTEQVKFEIPYEDLRWKNFKNLNGKDLAARIKNYVIPFIKDPNNKAVSTILNLKTDCIKETLSSKGHIEYKVVVQSKTSSNNSDEYNITRYVKSLIDEVKNITDNIRDEAIGIEKNYLFIYKRHSNSTISIVRQDALSVYHKKICNENNIRYLRLGAIRNYYQQQVSDYVTQNGDDPMLIEKLSKHGINVHIQHYDAVDIKAFCEKYYNIEIGNIELKGKIEKENLEDENKTVAHGCGHCDSDKCVLSGNLDCLMCDKFVTTLDCIPHFENEIKLIDELIVRQKIVHEKEFLIAKKKLNVAYLTKLYELEEKINGNKKI